MFGVAAVGQGRGSVRHLAFRILAALVGLGACDALSAADEPAAQAGEILVAAADIPRPQLEVNTAPVPHLHPTDAGASRLDMTLLPQQRSGIGLAMGIRSRSRGATGLAPHPPLATAVDLGVHWRYTSESNHRFDITAYRRAPDRDVISMIESREPSYGARLEMGLASRKDLRKGFTAQRGFIGLQLESGARLTIRRKFGGPMLYYRNTFY
ncbi:MAG TPA: hypothetical protein VM489_09005 [Burkholderiales bacterium]|nr:hypothetical protein [Burkholderiales bacterium]